MMAKKLFSILQADLSCCYVTGSTNVAIHHVFPGSGRRTHCEKYGFIVALRPDYHNMSGYSVHDNPNKGLDLELKQSCQRYFEEQCGSRDEFRTIFKMSYL